MRKQFRWAARPQFLLGFVIACLCVGALGNVARPALPSQTNQAIRAQVKGAVGFGAAPVNCVIVPCLALTFDDGPHSAVTPRILDILAREQVRATFFLVGSRTVGREHIVQRTYRDGHEIGNHSWSHASFIKLSAAQVHTELAMTQLAIIAAGVPAPHLFRPPYGAVDQKVMAHTGMAVVRWNIDPADWHYKNAGKITKEIMMHAKPGGIVLLHDTYDTTADALTQIIRSFKKRHYYFVTASQLLGVAPGDYGQYLGR